MPKITYNTKLIFKTSEDKNKILQMLEAQRLAWNECSKVKFGISDNSIVQLHKSFYRSFRDCQPEIPSQVIISAERSVLSAYRTIKSNKQKIVQAPVKKRLSIRLDGRSYSYKTGTFSIISLEKRVKCTLHLYSKLSSLINTYKFCDPLLFERNGTVYIAITFDVPETVSTTNLAVGIDLGCINFAATSEGKLYQDKKFSGRKRSLRYLKRCLQSKATKSANKRLKKLKRKEHNSNRNFTHHLAKQLIQDTKADVLVLENLKSIKVKKHKYQNKNRISQVSLFELKRILTYKALLFNKQVITVSPAYTSQIDHRTGERDGVREGGRYYGADGQLLHADCNAACNIAIRSKHPCSISNYYAWQVIVNSPIVSKCLQATNPLG